MSKAIRETHWRREASRTGYVRTALKLSKMRGCVAVGIIAASLFGCSGETSQPDDVAVGATETAAPDWKTLPDGSRAYFVQRENGSEEAERCWQVEQRWDCLGLLQMPRSTSTDSKASVEMAMDVDVDGPSYFGARVVKRELADPFPHFSEDNPVGGYECEAMGYGIISERVFSRASESGTTLLSNDSQPGKLNGGSPWTAEFVERFMTENAVKQDRPYWNCGYIKRLVTSGSLATITTTALRYDEMIGPESAEAF